MADVRPLQALHYDLSRTGGLQPVAAPPYDVIDAAQRAELLRRSPYNVVEVDLPQTGGDPPAPPAGVRRGGGADAIVARAAERALWPPQQPYPGRAGREPPRHGIFARVRVEDYGPG